MIYDMGYINSHYEFNLNGQQQEKVLFPSNYINSRSICYQIFREKILYG